MRTTLDRDLRILIMWERQHIHWKGIAYRLGLSYEVVKHAIYRVRGKDRRRVPRMTPDRRRTVV